MGNNMCMAVTQNKKKAIGCDHKKRKKVLSLTSAARKIKERAERSLKTKFVCDICVHKRPLSKSFRIKKCTHFYCNDCIIRYVVSKLDNNITSIKCPEIDCEGVLEWGDCRPILPEAVFDRWGVALFESSIEESKKFYCPYKNCSVLLICDELPWKYKSAMCFKCKGDICVKCGVPYHNELSCGEFQKLNKNSNVDAMLIKVAERKKWKKCPGCKCYVERSEGCRRIRCRCGQQFCYTCGLSLKHCYCLSLT